MFAVIKTGGKQYKVAKDDVLALERLDGEAGGKLAFDSVLMVVDGGRVVVGQPTVAGARVEAEIVEQGRAKKVIAFKKRRRKNSQKKRGHRQHITTVRVTAIHAA